MELGKCCCCFHVQNIFFFRILLNSVYFVIPSVHMSKQIYIQYLSFGRKTKTNLSSLTFSLLLLLFITKFMKTLRKKTENTILELKTPGLIVNYIFFLKFCLPLEFIFQFQNKFLIPILSSKIERSRKFEVFLPTPYSIPENWNVICANRVKRKVFGNRAIQHAIHETSE